MQLVQGILALAALGVGGVVAVRAWAAAAPTSANLGVAQGQLSPCPGTPNCVTTAQGPAEQRMAALPYRGTAAESRQRLLGVVQAMPRMTVVADEPSYLRVEARSALMRFVDDVEFAFDDAAGQIQFRSASRLGESDLGVNRARMEEISKRYTE